MHYFSSLTSPASFYLSNLLPLFLSHIEPQQVPSIKVDQVETFGEQEVASAVERVEWVRGAKGGHGPGVAGKPARKDKN